MKTGKPAMNKPPKGPYTLPCGCNAIYHRCAGEEALGERLDAARAHWLESHTFPGDAGFVAAYRPLLAARRAYHHHFAAQGAGRACDPNEDDLWQEHHSLLRDTLGERTAA